jgi:hypothetical protein
MRKEAIAHGAARKARSSSPTGGGLDAAESLSWHRCTVAKLLIVMVSARPCQVEHGDAARRTVGAATARWPPPVKVAAPREGGRPP